MFEFGLKHEYYHINKVAQLLFRKIIDTLVNYWRKNLLKIRREGLSILELFFETIPSSHFV